MPQGKARKISRKKIPARKQHIKKITLPNKTQKIIRKCIKCKVPLSGLLHKYIARPIFGVEPSKKKKGYCNKCE